MDNEVKLGSTEGNGVLKARSPHFPEELSDIGNRNLEAWKC